jgi:hypothetical protein
MNIQHTTHLAERLDDAHVIFVLFHLFAIA